MDIQTLAARQLSAYNTSDLDAFVACYHPEVRVFDDLELSFEGRDAFRARYAPMFEHGDFGGEVPQRVVMGIHCVDLEHWWRRDPETGERRHGSLLVRYTERDGLIGTVQFLR